MRYDVASFYSGIVSAFIIILMEGYEDKDESIRIGVDYPVVQGKDNEHYLHYTFDGKANKAGSIFLNYRNRAEFTGSKVILYGHNMKDGSMFSSLKKYQDVGFSLRGKEESMIYLCRPLSIFLHISYCINA